MDYTETLANIARALTGPAPVRAPRTLEPASELARHFRRERAGMYPVLALTPQSR